MTKPAVPEDEFIATWRQCHGNAKRVAETLGVSERNVMARRRRIEARTGEPLFALKRNPEVREVISSWQARVNVEIESGSVVVFSDAHYLPGPASRAHRGMLQVIADVRPVMVVANGDILDGTRISRHPPLGWDGPRYSVKEELKAVSERMGEVEDAARRARRGVKLRRTRGNHDSRFDVMLAGKVPEFEGVPGFRLSDHLPAWDESMSLMVNADAGVIPTMVKHRWHNGVHAAHNNLIKSGINIVTGHLHRLNEARWGDYNGRRYAVDTGTLAEVSAESFDYTEDNPTPWGSGFAVLTFHKHRLLPPEIAEVVDDGLAFRGHIYEV